jgi:broad specificity phosphatase PhoE
MPSADLRLVLVRHGLTDWNEAGRLLGRVDIGLNARGRAQADSLAEALQPVGLDVLLCSPQRRAQETAAPIARACGVGVHTEQALDEVWLGRWLGRTVDELTDDPDLARYMEDPTYECDAVEPTVSVRHRVAALVEHLRADAHGQTVGLVSHGDPLRNLIAHALTMDVEGFRRLTIATGSISVIQVRRHACRLRILNWIPGAGGPNRMMSDGR